MIDIEGRDYYALVPQTKGVDEYFKYFAEIWLMTDQKVPHNFKIDFITKPDKVAKLISDLIRGRYGNDILMVEVLSLRAEPFPIDRVQ